MGKYDGINMLLSIILIILAVWILNTETFIGVTFLLWAFTLITKVAQK